MGNWYKIRTSKKLVISIQNKQPGTNKLLQNNIKYYTTFNYCHKIGHIAKTLKEHVKLAFKTGNNILTKINNK